MLTGAAHLDSFLWAVFVCLCDCGRRRHDDVVAGEACSMIAELQMSAVIS